jgi:hypothetical protein
MLIPYTKPHINHKTSCKSIYIELLYFYLTCTHGFLIFLHQDIPFQWNNQEQQAFDALKHTLSNSH